MSRAIEYNWLNQLTAHQKTQLNELVRFGCQVGASEHQEDVIRVSVRYKRGVIADITGEHLGPVFTEAYAMTHHVLFGKALEPLHD